MAECEGRITLGSSEAKIVIFHKKPTTMNLSRWSGYGTSEELVEPGEYETNMGRIIINRVTGKNFSFIGNGPLLLSD